jgi:small subunit ribosomal protein S1
VTKIVAFGAFVQILPGVEGLVHISELAQHHVESPSEVVRPGDELKVKILEVDDSRRRLSLSVKQVEGQELPLREPEEGAVSAADEEAPAEGEAEEQPEAPEAEAPEAAPEAEVETPEAPPEEAPPEEAPEEETPDELPEEAPPEEQPVPDEGG